MEKRNSWLKCLNTCPLSKHPSIGLEDLETFPASRPGPSHEEKKLMVQDDQGKETEGESYAEELERWAAEGGSVISAVAESETEDSANEDRDESLGS